MKANNTERIYRNGAAESFIDSRLERGIVSFSLDELVEATGLTEVAAKNQLLRLKGRVVRVAPRQRYFLIVTPDQRIFGAPPVEWWLGDYFNWLGRPYYVALLSAAAIHGSSHQAVQVTQVMTDSPRRPIQIGRIRVCFYMKSEITRTITQRLPHAHSPLLISTPETTAFDLVRYAPRIGGIERAAETIESMLGRMNRRRLATVLQAETKMAAAARLGEVLEMLGAEKLANTVREWLRVPSTAHASSRKE